MKKHSDAQQDDWRHELTSALLAGAESNASDKWQKCSYDDDTRTKFDKQYDHFITQASWNFNRTSAPTFSKRPQTCLAKADSSENEECVMELQPLDPAELDGTAYARSSPTFFKARLGSKDNKNVVGLLDNCASLSLIDRKLLAHIPEVRIQEKHVRIQGVGSDESKEFCVLPIYIDCVRSKDGQKESARVKLWAEFHILDSLCESFVVGMDVIAPYQIDIMTSRSEARIRAEGAHNVPFPIFLGKGMPRGIQDSYSVIGAETVTIPAKSETTMRVMIAEHSPDTPTTPYDLFVHPIPVVNTAMQSLGVVGKGVYSSKTDRVWFANMGNQPITLRRGTKVAKAEPMSSSDIIRRTQIRHDVGGESPAEMFSCTPKKHGDVKAQKAVAIISEQSAVHWSTKVREHFADIPYPNDRSPPEATDPLPEDWPFDIAGDFGDGKPPECLVRTIQRNIRAFTLDGKPGRIKDSMTLRLDTEDEKLTPEKFRQTSPRKKLITDDTVDQLLEWDVIGRSNSRLSYQVVIVKQAGKDRFCVDYRDLNRYTAPLVYPMQRSDEMFEALGGKRIFSCLDAARGYHQIPTEENDRWKTAFLTHRGLFEYKMMPFGLKTAPALFQQFMDKLLGGLRWTAALCYIDDVIVFSDNVEEHADHLDKVLQAAIRTGLKFTLTKCHFGYASLKLLGRRVSSEGLEVIQDKLAAIRELRPPETIKQLWHVLGLFGYYRSFIHRYSLIAAPLIALTKGFSTKEDPGSAARTKIQWSESCQTAFETLKEKLTNPPVLAYPDFIKPFVLYVDASHDGMACALHQETARVPETMSYTTRIAEKENELSAARLSKAQREDPAWSRILQDITQFGQHFTVKDGMLYRGNRICLPRGKDIQRDIFHDIHDANGHLGFAKSCDKLSKQWYRTGMTAALRSYIQGCHTCAGAKKSRQKPQGDMTVQRHMANSPFDAIALEVFPLPMCQGYDACLTITDIFTKAVVLRPTTRRADVEDIAELLFTSVICKGFLPTTIISDNDSKYTSKMWTAIMKRLSTKISLSSPYHQQADPAELTIQTVQTVLRCYNDTDWVARLPFVELALNDAKHASTGFSLHELLYTANRSPVEALRTSKDEELPEILDYARARVKEAQENIKLAQIRQKTHYDRNHRRHDTIAVGDKAFLLLELRPVPTLPRNKTSWPKWGPFTVLEISADGDRLKLDFPKTHDIE
jgi:transposase InsO family protein